MRPDPVTLYKNGESRDIPGIDSSAWIANGWSIDPPSLPDLGSGKKLKAKPAEAKTNDTEHS